MDAHVATIVASYLSMNSSNVFFSMLGLAEHVITPTMATSASFIRSLPLYKQLEVIRLLKYPVHLIIATDNYRAALECIKPETLQHRELADMLTDFNRIGEYINDYPQGVMCACMHYCKAFGEYIKANNDDDRYIDYVTVVEDEIKDAYIKEKKIPESSLNYHQYHPTIENMVAIITKIRNDPYKYSIIYTRRRYYLTYSAYGTNRYVYLRIFCKNIYRFCNSQDDVLVMLRATFDNADDYYAYATEHYDSIDLQSILAIDACIDRM